MSASLVTGRTQLLFSLFSVAVLTIITLHSIIMYNILLHHFIVLLYYPIVLYLIIIMLHHITIVYYYIIYQKTHTSL